MPRGFQWPAGVTPPPRPARRIDPLAIADSLNRVFLPGAAVVFVLVWPGFAGDGIAPLVPDLDPGRQRRIEALEEALRRDPGDLRAATELSRLWHEHGQLPWSYSALRAAERRLARTPEAARYLSLTAAYLDLGEVADARRTLATSAELCLRQPCPEPLRFKQGLFRRYLDKLAERKIEPRRDRHFAEVALRELLRESAIDLPALERQRRRASGEGAPDARPTAAEPTPGAPPGP